MRTVRFPFALLVVAALALGCDNRQSGLTEPDEGSPLFSEVGSGHSAGCRSPGQGRHTPRVQNREVVELDVLPVAFVAPPPDRRP